MNHPAKLYSTYFLAIGYRVKRQEILFPSPDEFVSSLFKASLCQLISNTASIAMEIENQSQCQPTKDQNRLLSCQCYLS